MPARDDAGSNYGRPGGSQNSGAYNGGVAGGMGGGFGGGGAGINGGFNSRTGLTTSNVMKNSTQKGPAGGRSSELAATLAAAARPPNRGVVPTSAPPNIQAPLPPYEEAVPEIPRQLSYHPGNWWNNPTNPRANLFDPNRFPNSLDGMWRASGGWPGQGGAPRGSTGGSTYPRQPGDVRYPGGQTVLKNGNALPAPTGKEEIR